MMVLAGVMGDPIEHSLSPLIHRFWLKHSGMLYGRDYVPLHVRVDDLEAALRGLGKYGIVGVNLTAPHKELAMPFMHRLTDEAKAIGAVNIVRFGHDQRLRGDNSDAIGFAEPIADVDLTGRHALLIGAGGAARAVVYALKRKGIAHLTIMNRTASRASQLLLDFDMAGTVIPFGMAMPPADIIVNTVAGCRCGGDGHGSGTGYDLSAVPRDTIAYDIVYGPSDLRKPAQRARLRYIDGLPMLVGQAAVAYGIFYKSRPPRGLDARLLRALRRHRTPAPKGFC